MSDIKNKNIVLKGIEPKTFTRRDGGTFEKMIVTAEHDTDAAKTTRYTFSKQRADGKATAAYTAFQRIRPITGDILKIGYHERTRQYQDRTTGETKETTDYDIVTIELASGPGINVTPSAQKPSGNVPRAASQESNDEIMVEDIPF